MSDEPPKRTAAATAAWRRRAEERKASELRLRGWTVIPPDEAGEQLGARLVARVQRTQGHDGAWVLVDVRDAGAGDQLVATFTAPGYVPPAAHIAALRDLGALLAAQGFEVTTGWVVGDDARGRYATAPVRRLATDRQSVRDQG